MSRAPDANGWVSLSDVQWMNIVNHDHAYESMSKDDAVHAAVKATEAKLREINVLAKLRDDFAAKALPGVIAAIMQQECHRWTSADFAREAYELADAMLAERAK
ncbi:MAG: hypothetical protein V4641_01825 [Pseudomonadota bacterium]